MDRSEEPKVHRKIGWTFGSVQAKTAESAERMNLGSLGQHDPDFANKYSIW